MGDVMSIPLNIKCPACHFECTLANYQCGRGREFYDLALEGEEIPRRRGPMLTPSEQAARGADGRPPLNNRVMHAFNILANRLQKRHVEAGERKVVLTLSKMGSFMSVPFLAKRMLVSTEELDTSLEKAIQLGFVSIEPDERGVRMAHLTDAGKEKASQVQASQDENTAEFLSPLTDDEKETLEQIMRKLLAMR